MIKDHIKALRRQGKNPIIELTAAALIKTPKRATGRPRKYPEGFPLSARYVGKRGRARPTCGARGCSKSLRMNQRMACSDVCESSIINDAIYRLKQCGVTLAQLQELYGE